MITNYYLEGDDIRSNFAKESWRDATTLYEPYDFDSIMHYEKYVFIFIIIRTTLENVAKFLQTNL